MMKQIKQWMLILLLSTVFFTACKEGDDFYYKGEQQIANFAAVDQFFYFSPQDFVADYDLPVGILKPAEEDLTIPVEIVRNTKPQYIEIEGVTGSQFNVTIKKGETIGKIRVSVTTVGMVSGVADTLQLRLVKPIVSGQGTMHLVDETFLQIYPYCTFTQAQMPSLIGKKYTANRISGIDSDKVLPSPHTVTITNVVKDTMYMKNLFNIDPAANPNNVYRVYIDRSNIPYKLIIKEGDLLFYYSAQYGDIFTFNNNKTEYGSIDFCEGHMVIKAFAFSTKTSQYFSGSTELIYDLTEQP